MNSNSCNLELRNKWKYLLLLLGFWCHGILAQEKMPLQQLKKQANYWIQKANDSSDQNNNEALVYAKKALAISRQIPNDTLLSKVYNTLANAYQHKTLLDSAIVFHKQALQLRQKINSPIEIGDSYNNLGICSEFLGDLKIALTYYFKALSMYERQGNQSKQAMVLANIGIVYKEQKSYAKALNYYKKANVIYTSINDDFGKTATYGNMGSVLLNLKQYEKSIHYSAKAFEGYQALGFKNYLPYPVSNMAMALDSLGNYSQAETKFKEAILGHKETGNAYEVANVLNAYAKSLLKQKRYTESIQQSNEALVYIEKTNAEKLKVAQLQNLSKAYAGLNKFDKAYWFSQQYNAIKDTLFEKEKAKAVFELETKYQTAKKDALLIKSKNQLAERERRIKEKNKLFYFASGMAFLLGLIGFLVYQQQRLKNKQIIKENELKQALIKIENQNNLQQQRLAISKDLHDNIGAQLTFIISSLDNLKYFDFTKEKLYSKFDAIGTFTRSTITDLRDTIWAMNKEHITFEDLKIRTTNFIEAARTSLIGIAFSFTHPPQSEEICFNALMGIDVYRIIQEAVNNAVKHAKATQISVRFENKNNQLEITIQDNGTGFDTTSIEAGNGMLSMKKRAREIGATLQLTSSDTGTLVQLCLPEQ